MRRHVWLLVRPSVLGRLECVLYQPSDQGVLLVCLVLHESLSLSYLWWRYASDVPARYLVLYPDVLCMQAPILALLSQDLWFRRETAPACCAIDEAGGAVPSPHERLHVHQQASADSTNL